MAKRDFASRISAKYPFEAVPLEQYVLLGCVVHSPDTSNKQKSFLHMCCAYRDGFFFPVEIVKAFEEACVDTQDYMQKDYLAHQEYIRLSVDVK